MLQQLMLVPQDHVLMPQHMMLMLLLLPLLLIPQQLMMMLQQLMIMSHETAVYLSNFVKIEGKYSLEINLCRLMPQQLMLMLLLLILINIFFRSSFGSHSENMANSAKTEIQLTPFMNIFFFNSGLKSGSTKS